MKLAACSKDFFPPPTCRKETTRYSSLTKFKFPNTINLFTSISSARISIDTNPKRVQWTAGGDKIKYTENITTQTADIQTAKCLFNSVVITLNVRFITLDLKYFYL